jgi:hypothetical protein
VRRVSPAQRHLAALLSAAALVSGCGGDAATTASVAGSAAGLSPCGRASPGSASYDHVLWIWMENTSYGNVIGSTSAPFQNALGVKCGLATNYHDITYPSLPNYVAATSGLGREDLDRFASNCDPSPDCSTEADSIFSEVSSWRAYEESMPTPCDREDSDAYAVRHNPPPYFSALAGCARNDLPLSALGPDLANDSLPAFSFLTPNLCHDAHDCGVDSGDAWLAEEVPRIVDSPAYRSGHLAVFITYDEGERGETNDCAANQRDPGCRVATLLVSPSTPIGARSDELFNHYSLLRTAEDLLGVPRLGEAARATSMTKPFGLGAASP